MSENDPIRDSLLGELYRANARERSAPELDAAILAHAREHARRARAWRRYTPLLAAAVVLSALGLFRWHRAEQSELAAARMHYRSIASTYLFSVQLAASGSSATAPMSTEQKE